MYLKRLFASAVAVLFVVCTFAQTKTTVFSPAKNIQLDFWLSDNGTPMYSVMYKSKPVILSSAMGFKITDTYNNTPLPSLTDSITQLNSAQQAVNNKWQPVWGE